MFDYNIPNSLLLGSNQSAPYSLKGHTIHLSYQQLVILGKKSWEQRTIIRFQKGRVNEFLGLNKFDIIFVVFNFLFIFAFHFHIHQVQHLSIHTPTTQLVLDGGNTLVARGNTLRNHFGIHFDRGLIPYGSKPQKHFNFLFNTFRAKKY